MEIRPLKGKDAFTIIRFLNKLDIKDLIKLFTSNPQEDTDDIEALGQGYVYKLADVILEKVPEMENDINELLADVTNSSAVDIAELPLKDYAQLIVDFVQNDDFKYFFELFKSQTKSAE